MERPEGSCLDAEQIDRAAEGEPLSEAASRHAETCGNCAQALRIAREDAAFLHRVRVLSGPELGPTDAPRIPGYRAVGVINAGAQGVVYRALQESTSRTVAVKVISAGPSATPRQRARAEREAEIVARLRHPNIVTVFESRTLSDGRIAVIMEFVDGVPIDAWKPPGQTDSERQRALLGVLMAVCNGIHHAHLNGVIHRDLKPDNVLVTPEGRPVVLDFGIAKAGGLHATMTGEFAGTPAFASPEQVAGRPEDVDALTDVYSLGVILYRLLCGAMPYTIDGSILDVARAIESAPVVAPRRRNPAIPADLEAVMLRAMSRDRSRRYQSAAGLARDIERYLAGDPVDARSASGWYLLRKALLVNRRRLAVVGAIAAVLLGAGATVAISLARAADSAAIARRQQLAAEAEAVRARAVVEFMREALPATDPAQRDGGLPGSNFGRLFFRLETGAFADDPEVDQALRRLWGSVYSGFGGRRVAGLVEYAEVSLRTGLMRLRRQHGAEHPDIAATLHELAGVLLVRQRTAEAEHACREALDMRERLLGAGAVATADTRALLAHILLASGRDAEALREADLALEAFGSMPENEADLRIGAISALKGRALLEGPTPCAAEDFVRDALVRRLRHLPPDDPDLLVALADAAELAARCPSSALTRELAEAWGVEPGGVPQAVRDDLPVLAAIERTLADVSTEAQRSRALNHVLALQERFLGDLDPALMSVLIERIRAYPSPESSASRSDALLRAADILSRRFGPDDPSVQLCNEEAALVLVYAGEPHRAVELQRRACEAWLAVPEAARDQLMLADCRRRLAWYMTIAGLWNEAIPEYQSAIAILDHTFDFEHHTRALAQSGLAFCLVEVGRKSEADALSEAALGVVEQLPAIPPDQLANIRFARAHVLCAIGRPAEARPLLEMAWDAYYHLVTEQFRLYRPFIEDMALACESEGDGDAAAAWRARIGG